MYRIIILALIISGCFCQGSRAQGVLDFLDPCIGAKQNYWQERAAILNSIDFKIEATNSENASPKFRDWWWNEKRTAMRVYFNNDIWPILAQSGVTNQEAAFTVWIRRQVEASGGDQKMDYLMNKEYRRLRVLVLKQQRGEDYESLERSRRDLYGSCPQDVANQVFRGAQVVVTAPIGLISRNIEIAKRESGVIAQGVGAVTGISVGDIRKNGPLGGNNSEARKVCNGVAGIFGGSC